MTVPHARMVTPTNFLIGKRYQQSGMYGQHFALIPTACDTHMKQINRKILEEELTEIFVVRTEHEHERGQIPKSATADSQKILLHHE